MGDGKVAEWFKAAVLKTAGPQGLGFESLPFCQIDSMARPEGAFWRFTFQLVAPRALTFFIRFSRLNLVLLSTIINPRYLLDQL